MTTMGLQCRKCGTVIQPGTCYLVNEDGCPRCSAEEGEVSESSNFPNPWLGDVNAGERQTHQDLKAIHATLERIAAALEAIAETLVLSTPVRRKS